jgi:hypothetical protein
MNIPKHVMPGYGYDSISKYNIFLRKKKTIFSMTEIRVNCRRKATLQLNLLLFSAPLSI